MFEGGYDMGTPTAGAVSVEFGCSVSQGASCDNDTEYGEKAKDIKTHADHRRKIADVPAATDNPLDQGYACSISLMPDFRHDGVLGFPL